MLPARGGPMLASARHSRCASAPTPRRTFAPASKAQMAAAGRRSGHNVTDAYRLEHVFLNANVLSRFVGQPATYGVAVSGRL